MIYLLIFMLLAMTSMGSLDYFKEIERCAFTEKGEEYIGTVSTTKSGRNCKPWTKLLESRTDIKGTHLSDKDTIMAHNYCRNPNFNQNGTWCYYGDSDNEWEPCNIPRCVEIDNCKHTNKGTEFDGFTNVTKYGQSCQSWEQQKPHGHRFTETSFPEKSFRKIGNKCRNPDEESSPWCYTMDAAVRWEFCDIPVCKESLSQVEYFRGQDFQSLMSKKTIEFDMKELLSSVTFILEVPIKFWSEDIQRKTSVRSTKYSSKCQRDLTYYEYCPVDQIITNSLIVKITFICKTPVLSAIIITPLDRAQFTQTLIKGSQYVINNEPESGLKQYIKEINTGVDITSVKISIEGNASPFYLLDDNVIPYAVTKDDDIALTISKYGLGSIGFICGEYFTKKEYRTKLKDFYTRVYRRGDVIPKYVNENYLKTLEASWKNKNEVEGSVIWNCHETIGKENVKLLVSMIARGLNIIVGIKAWAYYHYVSKFEESELTDLFLAAGLWPDTNIIYGDLRIINSVEVKLFPLVYLLDYAKTNLTSAVAVAKMVKNGISNVPYKTFVGSPLMNNLKTKVSALYQTYDDVIPSWVPCLEKPLMDKDIRLLLDMFNTILLHSLGNIFKAPGINFYPGTLNLKLNTYENVKIKLSLQFNNENYFIGIFLPASTNSVIELNTKKSKKCTLNVNFHLFDVTNWDRWDKWPRTKSDYVIESGKTEIISDSFGGLISIICDTNDDSVELRLTNVLRAPMYNLRNGPVDSSWHNLKRTSVPWAILTSDTLVFLVPSIAIRNMEDPEPIMKQWDEMIKEQFHLRGRSVAETYREMVSTDFQIKAGYMHAGYPIGTFIQHIANPMIRSKYVFASEKIKREGYWGVNHEVGHNLQKSIFTFSGTVDVTNNVFTLVATESMTGQSSWNESEGWVNEGRLPDLIYYINTRNFSYWQERPFVGLGTYAQLRADFGWEFFRQIFRRYDELIVTYGKRGDSLTNEERIQLWIIESSDLVKMNLVPLYDYWAWPITEETKKTLAKYPAFLSDDFLTKKTQEKVRDILAKYGGEKIVTRTPLKISTVIGPLKKDIKIEGRKVIEEITVL